MRRQSFYNHRVSIVFCADWTSSATCLFLANRTCIRRTLMRLLRHMRTRASLKIASVIQPGRRWDSRAKLTSPVFLYTFFLKIMGYSRWKVVAAVVFALVCSLSPVDADEHDHTVRHLFERPTEKGEP